MPPKAKGKKSAPGGKDKKAPKGKKEKGKNTANAKKSPKNSPKEEIKEPSPPPPTPPPPIPLVEKNKPYLEARCKSIVEKIYEKDEPLLYQSNHKQHLGTPIQRIFQEILHPHLIQYMRDIGLLPLDAALNLKKIDNRTPLLGPTGIEVLHVDRIVIPSMLGVAVKMIYKNAITMYVKPGTPAYWAGLRFGDEILDVNDGFVYSWTNEEFDEFIHDQPGNRFDIIIRRRPFTRSFTLLSAKCEKIGFQIHEGRICNVYEGTEAYTKGLLVDYQIIEINNSNVIGMEDKQMRFAFQRGKQFSVTVMPTLIFEHLMGKMVKETVFDYYHQFQLPV